MTDPEYSGGVVRELERRFRGASLFRPLRVRRHEPMEVLDYDVRGVWPPRPARVKLSVERHVGGGFAGQVYRVRILEIDAPEQVAELIGELGHDPAAYREFLAGDGAKQLEACIEEAHADHVFGVPLFIVNGEPFWGHDRIPLLEERLGELGLARKER